MCNCAIDGGFDKLMEYLELLLSDWTFSEMNAEIISDMSEMMVCFLDSGVVTQGKSNKDDMLKELMGPCGRMCNEKTQRKTTSCIIEGSALDGELYMAATAAAALCAVTKGAKCGELLTLFIGKNGVLRESIGEFADQTVQYLKDEVESSVFGPITAPINALSTIVQNEIPAAIEQCRKEGESIAQSLQDTFSDLQNVVSSGQSVMKIKQNVDDLMKKSKDAADLMNEPTWKLLGQYGGKFVNAAMNGNIKEVTQDTLDMFTLNPKDFEGTLDTVSGLFSGGGVGGDLLNSLNSLPKKLEGAKLNLAANACPALKNAINKVESNLGAAKSGVDTAAKMQKS